MLEFTGCESYAITNAGGEGVFEAVLAVHERTRIRGNHSKKRGTNADQNQGIMAERLYETILFGEKRSSWGAKNF